MIAHILNNIDHLKFNGNDCHHLKNYVLRLRFYIKNAQRVFIYTQDRFLFICAFLAAKSMNKTIILLQSNKNQMTLTNGADIFIDDVVFHSLQQEELSLKDIEQTDSTIIFYTSGTTGQPKEIIKKFSQLEAEVLALKKTFSIHNGCFISTVPHHHIYGFLFSVLLPLYTDSMIVKNTCVLIEDILSIKNDHLILISSPTHLKRIGKDHIGKFKMIFSSSAPLSYEAAQHCLMYLDSLPIEIYGSTETGGIAYRQQYKENTPWKLFLGMQIHQQSDGSLTIESPYLLNQEKIHDDLFFHSKDEFDLLKRLDRTVKIEGKRISLEDIEGQLLRHPFVKDVRLCVLDLNHRITLGGIIVLSEKGENLLKKEIIDVLKNYLNDFYDLIFIPRKWRIVHCITKNSLGKYDDIELKKLFA
ncbi:MAG: D-alanine--D-alanyl carrier protein ligase [Holosporales bacterium]